MYRKILAPLDGSELAEAVFPHVGTIARGCGAEEVILLEVVEPFNMPRGVDGPLLTEEEIKSLDSGAMQAAREYMERASISLTLDMVNVTWDAVFGNPAAAIAQYATSREADLIIIASHGRSGISRLFMGSVAEKVLRSACMPVFIVRPPGCEPAE